MDKIPFKHRTAFKICCLFSLSICVSARTGHREQNSISFTSVFQIMKTFFGWFPFFQTALEHVFSPHCYPPCMGTGWCCTLWATALIKKTKLLWACLWICVHLCRSRWVRLPEWVFCNDNENPWYSASHLCSIVFPQGAEIILLN